jgi:hypothetical protein
MKSLACIVMMILVPAAARAQITLPNVRLPVLPQVPLTQTVAEDARTDVRMLREVRRQVVRDLIRRNRSVIQADRNGAAIVRGEILAVSPEQGVIDAMTAAGFTVLRTRVLEGLDAQIVVLGVPAGVDTLRALAQVRSLAPAGRFDFNHIYTSSGVWQGAGVSQAAGVSHAAGVSQAAGASAAVGPFAVAGASAAAGVSQPAGGSAASEPAPALVVSLVSAVAKVGLIDSGVDVGHPVFKGMSVHQHGCASGPVPDAHGTAVASLLVGRSVDSTGSPGFRSPPDLRGSASLHGSAGLQGSAEFHSSAPGADLYAVDVYCGMPTGGAADAVAEAFSWLAHEHVPVINVSLVGPANVTLESVIRLVVARGHLVVAAVGNDGPAAPPLYPASYPGVVGVTAVDAHRRVLFEAGRGPQVRFAARGADLSAAKSVQTFELVRGTSFAAPLVAGLLAARLPAPDLGRAQRAVDELAREAVDLGASGVDPVYGYGLVGADLAVGRKP